MKIEKKDIVDYIKQINLQYINPYSFENDNDKIQFINLWYEALKEYPKEKVDTAIKDIIFKSEFAPKIATIIKEIETSLTPAEISDRMAIKVCVDKEKVKNARKNGWTENQIQQYLKEQAIIKGVKL